jgi:hypothetical protein
MKTIGKWLALPILAALSVAAVMTFALPASAEFEGSYWYDHLDNRAPTEEEPKEVEPTAALTFTVGALRVTCVELEMKGELWNSEVTGMGEGTITKGTGITCNTNIPGCEVDASTPVFPWHLTTTETFLVEVSGFKIEHHFAKECEKFGVPLTATVSGTATGMFDGLLSAIVFEESGDLKSTPGGISVGLDGRINFGTKLTVEFL